jgi:hypothetical protein
MSVLASEVVPVAALAVEARMKAKLAAAIPVRLQTARWDIRATSGVSAISPR